MSILGHQKTKQTSKKTLNFGAQNSSTLGHKILYFWAMKSSTLGHKTLYFGAQNPLVFASAWLYSTFGEDLGGFGVFWSGAAVLNILIFPQRGARSGGCGRWSSKRSSRTSPKKTTPWKRWWRGSKVPGGENGEKKSDFVSRKRILGRA